MALLTPEEVAIGNTLRQSSLDRKASDLAPKDPNISYTEALPAAFRQENTLVSKDQVPEIGVDERDPDFDPVKSFTEQATTRGMIVNDDQLSFASKANSQEELDLVFGYIDQQQKDRAMISEAGLNGFLAVATASIVDPINVWSGGLSLLSKGSKLVTAAKAAGIIGGATVAQETVLQGTQTERTATESAMNIAVSAGIGAILGGFIGGIPKSGRIGLDKHLEGKLTGTETRPRSLDEIQAREHESVGAAVSKQDIDQIKREESIAGLPEGLIKGLTGFNLIRSPILRASLATTGTLRKIGNSLFENPLIVNKNLEGIESSQAVKSLIDQEVTIRMSTLERDIVGKIYNKHKNEMSWEVFNEEVSRAIREGDHQVAYVKQAAERMRKELDGLAKELQAREILPMDLDVKTASGYLTRRYRKEAILTNRAKWDSIIRPHIQKFDKLGKVREQPLSPNEAGLIGDEITDHILRGSNFETEGSALTKSLAAGEPKFSNKRAFIIPDTLIKDFTDNNAFDLTSSYINNSVAVKHFQDFMINNGYKEVKDIFDELSDELTKRMDDLNTKGYSPEKLAKKQAKLLQAAKDDKALLEDLIKLSLGTFTKQGPLDDSLQILRKYQMMTKLGGNLITSMVELGMPVFRFGLGRTFKGYVDVLSSLVGDGKATKELKAFGIGVESEMNNLLAVMSDPSDINMFGRSSALKYADKASVAYSKMTGMSYYTQFGRTLSSHIASARILDFVEQAQTGVIKDIDLATLRKLGISQADEAAIMKQLKSVGDKENWFANIDSWEPGIRNKFANAIYQDVNSSILQASAGDIPLAAQRTQLGKTAFQFKPFSSGATSRVLLSGLQRLSMKDANVLVGTVTLIQLGYTAYYIKSLLSGKKPKTDPETVIAEGLMRSGLTGLWVDSVIRLLPILSTETRWKGRNAESAIFGPSGSLVKSLMDVGYGFTDGEITNSDKDKLLDLIPGNNIFYIRGLVEKAMGITAKDK